MKEAGWNRVDDIQLESAFASKFKFKCYYCGKMGHKRSERKAFARYGKYKPKYVSGQKAPGHKAHFSEQCKSNNDNQEKDVSFLADIYEDKEQAMSSNSSQFNWYLDSGATE